MSGTDLKYISTIALKISVLKYCIVEILGIELFVRTNYNGEKAENTTGRLPKNG